MIDGLSSDRKEKQQPTAADQIGCCYAPRDGSHLLLVDPRRRRCASSLPARSNAPTVAVVAGEGRETMLSLRSLHGRGWGG